MTPEAVAWAGNPVCPKDAQGNRQFLAHFAIHLVQQFRFEEAQLKAAKSPRLANHRQANHRLALQLRNLMTAVDRGLDVTSDIRAFLEAWRRHQERVPVWTAAAVGKGH
jgi:hemerythrin